MSATDQTLLPSSQNASTSVSTVDEIIMSYETMDNTYKFTRTTFTKTSRLPQYLPGDDGTLFKWQRSWAAERITNEANALKLVRQKTEILVPRVIKHGTHPDGTRYLVTELIDGIMLNGVHRESCFLPQGEEKHTTETPCHTCVDRAYSNAVDYIEKIVQPQLENIRYYERGLEGLVMPPQWLAIDVDPLWKGIKGQFKILRQDNSDYVFQHGDLSDRNIIIDKETLQVMALIDWEYAGTFLKAWITGRGRWMKTCVVPELMFRL